MVEKEIYYKWHSTRERHSRVQIRGSWWQAEICWCSMPSVWHWQSCKPMNPQRRNESLLDLFGQKTNKQTIPRVGGCHSHIDRTMSHARSRADGCQCSRKNRYCQLNNGFPKFFVFHSVLRFVDPNKIKSWTSEANFILLLLRENRRALRDSYGIFPFNAKSS